MYVVKNALFFGCEARARCSIWIVAPETMVARHRRQTGDHIVMVVLYMCAGI